MLCPVPWARELGYLGARAIPDKVVVAAAHSWHGDPRGTKRHQRHLEEGDPESLVLLLRLLFVIPESNDVQSCRLSD